MSPDDPTQFSPLPVPGLTPTNYQRTTGGNFRWQPPTVEHLQKLLPQYEIISLLGHGGMGAVYKARQITLDRLVAIKILPPEAADNDPQFIERFKNEARSMAKMNHPAIVHVYDYGETAEQQLYFVMEFVDGTDVQKMIKESGKLGADYAIGITAHVCDALQYAHSHGVIHRDIKPANVLLDMEGNVKVADFGLAKINDAAQTMGLTRSSMAMGTPDYIAPETLILGVVADHRADLYAVGVMLYYMLTGEIPRGKFKMPSQKVGSDPRFDAIIDRAMETDREERYQSALEIRQDLDVMLTTPVPKQEDVPLPELAATVPMRKPVMSGPGQRAAVSQALPSKKSSAGMMAGMVSAAIVIGIFTLIAFHQVRHTNSTALSADHSPRTTTMPMPDQPGAEALKNFLIGTSWLWNGSSKYKMEFLGDGTVEVADWTRKGFVTGWKAVSQNEVELTILSGRDTDRTAKIIFADDRASFTGVNFDKTQVVEKVRAWINPFIALRQLLPLPQPRTRPL